MIRKTLLLFVCLLTLGGCFHVKKPSYRIGIDPSWFPLQLRRQEVNVFAFTTELLQEIAELKGVEFERFTMSWDNLLLNLREKKYDAIFSSMQPSVFNECDYCFSQIFLETGPVLVVPSASGFDSLEDLEGRVVGIEGRSSILSLFSEYPDIEPAFYPNVHQALESMIQGQYAGCLIPLLPAQVFLRELFRDKLEIVSEPLIDEGLRMVSYGSRSDQLIALFNDSIEELKQSGRYDELLSKWSLSN